MKRLKTTTEYQPPAKIVVTGATAPDGRPFAKVRASGRSAWLPRDAFMGGGGVALRMLKEANMPMLPGEWKQCRSKVTQLTSYPPKLLIDRRGWNGGTLP